jgi:hypothetical protein
MFDPTDHLTPAALRNRLDTLLAQLSPAQPVYIAWRPVVHGSPELESHLTAAVIENMPADQHIFLERFPAPRIEVLSDTAALVEVDGEHIEMLVDELVSWWLERGHRVHPVVEL